MHFAKTAQPCKFRIHTTHGIAMANGWWSTQALGILSEGPTNFSSFLLLPGVRLAAGFETLRLAHTFNLTVLRYNKRIYVGSPRLADMFASAGGREEAMRVIEGLKLEARSQALKDAKAKKK